MTNPSPTQACHRSTYQVLKASGDDIRDYLQSQITQDISSLTPQTPIYTAVLTPQGKAVADLHIMDAGDELIMLCVADYAEALINRLRRFALGHAVRMGVVDSLALLSIQGNESESICHSLVAQSEASMWMPEAAQHGYWLVVNQSQVQDILKQVPHTCHDSDMEQKTIIHGHPRFGRDWDSSISPMQANIIEMHGISFDKGCYVGQEIMSRMRWRGGIKKKLYHVQLTCMPTATPRPIQTPSGINIGTLTSAATDHTGQAWGMAHLPIETVESNSPLYLENGGKVHIIHPCQQP